MDDEDEVDIVGEFSEQLLTPAPNSCNEEMGLNISELLPCLGHGNSWLLNADQVWNLDASIDDSKSLLHKCKPDREVKSRHAFSNEIKTSTSSSHKKHWTETEKEMFEKGIKAYGHSWAKISKFIGTRTTLQVKNFARQYLKHTAEKITSLGETDKFAVSSSDNDLKDNAMPAFSDHIYEIERPTVFHVDIKPSKRQSSLKSVVASVKKPGVVPLEPNIDPKKPRVRRTMVNIVPSKEIVKIHKESASSESEDVDIEDICGHSQKLLLKYPTEFACQDDIVSCNEKNTSDANSLSSTHGLLNDEAANQVEPSLLSFEKESSLDQLAFINASLPVIRTVDTYSNEDLKDVDMMDQMDDMPSADCESRRIFYLAVPEKELLLEKELITEEEKEVHQEFFEGRPQKTPERYLKIRNYILDSWEKSKPIYLNKTSVRTGLKNCGDVNCIGRIHMYLEQIGAINFGCDQTVYSRPFVLLGRSLPSGKKTNSGMDLSSQFSREMMRPRKRKIPVLSYDSEGGGYTIKHGEDGEIIDVTEGLVPQAPTQKRVKVGDDPFKLIVCSEFSAEKPAPFTLKVHITALIVMDVHAHLSTLEVIGLLGGHFDCERAVLHIVKAEPCESLSTGLECEMDPVSQTLASEKLQQEGYSIVGWYHSHPMFAPNPSVRDLDTQAKFQEWFGQGGAPFLGVIISPYLSFSLYSKMRYIIVGEEHVMPEGYRKPYKFIPEYFHCNSDAEEIISNTVALVQKWRTSPLSEGKTSVTVLNKMLRSIQHHLTQAQLSQNVIQSVIKEFGKMLLAQLIEDSEDNEQFSKLCTISVCEQKTNNAENSDSLSAKD